MRFVSGQKALVAFLFLLGTAVSLTVFLDNPAGEKRYILLSICVFITDAVCYASLFHTVYKEVRSIEADGVGIVALWNFLFPFNNIYAGQFVCITCKVVFEMLIAVRLTFSVSIPFFIHFIPFWIFCGIIFYDLSTRLYSINQKAYFHPNH